MRIPDNDYHRNASSCALN